MPHHFPYSLTLSLQPRLRLRTCLAAAVLLIGAFLGACGANGPSTDLPLPVPVASSEASLTSSIWTSPERSNALPMASGDGVKTTASSVDQLLGSANGIYFGPRVAKEDWPGLINRYKRDASVVSWVKGERARIDNWISKKFERPDLVGGWQLAYVNPGTGLAETWTVDSPEPPNGNTDVQRAYKGAWVAIGRDYNIAQMQAAARMYRLTGNVAYAEWAAGQLDFYADNYARWPLRTSEGRCTMYQSGLGEATAAFGLIDAARLLEVYAGSARSQHWHDVLFMPMAQNLKSTSAPLSNIQVWHMGAIAAIAMRYKDAALLDFAQNSPQGIKANMADGLTVDNFWKEGTFAYNAYMVTALSKIVVQADVEGYADNFAELRDQAIRLLLVTLDYRFDDNTLPNPNDSREAQQVAPNGPHWLLFRVAPTYWGLKTANEWRTWESLLDPPAPIPKNPPTLPTAKTRNFTAMRQAVLRAGNWQAYIHYGQINGNHVQHELLNFELHYGATPIAYDPGTVDYGSPYHTGYFQMGPANNVPLVDGLGQVQWAPGKLLSFSATENRLVAEQPKYLPDVDVVRGYRVTTGGFVEQSAITVANGAIRRLGIAFSTTCEVRMGNGATDSPVLPLPNVTAMSYWTQVHMFMGAAQWNAQLNCGGNNRFQMTVTGPANQHIYLVKAPNTPMPSTRNTLYYEVQGSSSNFQTEIKQAP